MMDVFWMAKTAPDALYDITGRKQAEEALKTVGAEFPQYLDSSLMGISSVIVGMSGQPECLVC